MAWLLVRNEDHGGLAIIPAQAQASQEARGWQVLAGPVDERIELDALEPEDIDRLVREHKGETDPPKSTRTTRAKKEN